MGRNKIGAYYRLSIEDDDGKEESNSITNQRLLIRRYVSGHKELSDYEYSEFYDDGYSGTTMERPGIQALLEEVRQNEIGCVIVKDLSRFSRDYIEMGTYLEQIFPFLGIRFISVTDHYDSKDYIGKTADIDIGFKTLLADFYCKDISEKVKSSVSAKRKQGKYATGNTPFGYGKNPENPYELLILPEEAEVVRHIFELSLAGRNLTQICKTLNDESVLTPLEFKNLRKSQRRKELLQERKYWQPGTVRAILTNKNYVGSMVWHKSSQAEVGSSRKILKPREEWEVVETHHPAIVRREVFDKVQEKFFQKAPAVRNPILYALKGKVYCGYCKRRLKVMKLADRKLFFYCASQKLSSENECMADSISNEVLEKIVLEQIKKQVEELADLDFVRKTALRAVKEKQTGLVRDMKIVEQGIQELIEKKGLLLEGYHAGTHTREGYLEGRRQLEQRISVLEQRRAGIRDEMAKYEKLPESERKGQEFLLKYAGFAELTNEMADAFVDRIEIGQDKAVDIFWRFHGGKVDGQRGCLSEI